MATGITSVGDFPTMTLGRQDRVMTWCSALNIYKVNRFHLMNLEPAKATNRRPRNYDELGDNKVDIITGLLCHNMLEQVEMIFEILGMKSTWRCRQVNKTWNDFITNHIFKRWAFKMVLCDPLLSVDLQQYIHSATKGPDQDELLFGKIIRNVHNLRDCWRRNQPQTHRVKCDSFVLSVMTTQNPNTLDTFIYCGLNNGDLQMWSRSDGEGKVKNNYVKVREMEMHRKGVKV